MSKETGVEFAKITINGEAYILRGDKTGTDIPDSVLAKMKACSGQLEFHSHPHNDDCIPSRKDKALIGKLRPYTGQSYSTIVTTNGRTSTFNEHGLITIGTVENKIDEENKKMYEILFGGL